MIRAVIWDLDGTLIDSYRCIVPSLRQFYAEQGLALDEKDIRSAILRGSVRAFAEAVRQQTGISLDAGMGRYREIRMEQEQALAPMPGARAVLDALAAAGVPSFLYTHRGETTEAVLERTGLAGAFCERDSPYTYAEYRAHLDATLDRAGREANYAVELTRKRAFRNLQIVMREGEWVMLSKQKSPAIHFVIRQSQLRRAIENMVLPVVE